MFLKKANSVTCSEEEEIVYYNYGIKINKSNRQNSSSFLVSSIVFLLIIINKAEMTKLFIFNVG